MKPLTQTRIGHPNGNCMAASLASVLETPIPEFGVDVPEAVFFRNLDRWLAKRGLRYRQVPIDRENPPAGWHLIEGTSPRGGQHAVVGKNGKFVHDPHPVWDDPRRGLAREERWGILEPISRGTARDSVTSAQAHHEAIKATVPRPSGEVADFVGSVASLLRSSRIGNKKEWEVRMDKAEAALRQGRQEYALTAAHHVLDALRALERRRGRANDSAPCCPVDPGVHSACHPLGDVRAKAQDSASLFAVLAAYLIGRYFAGRAARCEKGSGTLHAGR